MFGLGRRKRAEMDAQEQARLEKLDEEQNQLAVFVKFKAQAAKMFASRLNDRKENREKQYKHYASCRDQALNAIAYIDDEFYRGFACHMLITALVAAEELATAKALMLLVEDDDIRSKILSEFPDLTPKAVDLSSETTR